MAVTIVNGIIVLLMAGITYALISEGIWGAGLMFFNILFAGLLAFNFYEPLAKLIIEQEILTGYADTLALLVIFGVSVTLLRIITETLGPAMVRFPRPLFQIGRLVFALGGAAVTMAIMILAFETAPVNKLVFGAIGYDSKPPYGLALDRHWLGFFQYTTGVPFADFSGERDDREFHLANVFDPTGSWLIDHQNARPYGDEVVPPPEEASTTAAGGAAPGQAPVAAPQGKAGGSVAVPQQGRRRQD